MKQLNVFSSCVGIRSWAPHEPPAQPSTAGFDSSPEMLAQAPWFTLFGENPAGMCLLSKHRAQGHGNRVDTFLHVPQSHFTNIWFFEFPFFKILICPGFFPYKTPSVWLKAPFLAATGGCELARPCRDLCPQQEPGLTIFKVLLMAWMTGRKYWQIIFVKDYYVKAVKPP